MYSASTSDVMKSYIMAVGDAQMFLGFLTPVLTQLLFQSHRLLLSHVSAEVRGENTPERKLASQPPGHKSDTFTTEQPVRGFKGNFAWSPIVYPSEFIYRFL